MSSPEEFKGPENAHEMPTVSAEQLEHLSNPETASNLDIESGEKKEAQARVEALETAIKIEKGSAEKEKQASTAPPRRRGAISKKEKEASFKKHIKDVQAQLPLRERAFSKLIHNPVVEKTSEFIGATVARPNAILAGAVVAFFAVLGVYLLAKNYGYVLSGFETIAAFVIGWVIGILYDYFRTLITGKK